MGKDGLRLEVFASDKVVSICSFHIYNIKSQNIDDNSYKIIRGACSKLANVNRRLGIFENGSQIISTDLIDNIPNGIDFSLEYVGYEKLDIQSNTRVYGRYIEYLIKNNLSSVKVLEKYNKYSCKSDITSAWFRSAEGSFGTYKSDDKIISLERIYNIHVEIGKDGKAYLWLDTKTGFRSKLTVMDMLEKRIDVLGMEVKNDWGQFRQTGILAEISQTKVIDPLNELSCSLKDYYIYKKNEAYLVEKLPDCTPVVYVKSKSGGNMLSYYPQALIPVLTREKVGILAPDFSTRIEPVVKRSMANRIILDKEFITDIGNIDNLNGLAFEIDTTNLDSLGLAATTVSMPQLMCGDGKFINCGNEYQIFNHGFYQKPNRKLRIGYLYPRGEKELLVQVANDIYSYAMLGKYHGETDNYIIPGLIDIQTQPEITQEYDVGNITDYKRAALKLKNIEQIDIVIALIPDGLDEDSPYNPFKKIWAELNIPSQMISMKTARKFCSDAKSKGTSSKYYLQNIVLGILGKTGGIPWIVKNMPGNVDCFVGLDVSTQAKGIHYPTCSVVFDRYGRMLGFFKPRVAQQGEKITTQILQDVFDQVILSYENEYGEKPKNIVIHRDGFSNEDKEWYEHYFKAQGINYAIIEVRKNIYKKMLDIDTSDMNPSAGSCIYNSNKAYLVTTVMKGRKGSPNPLLIEKACGNISIGEAVTQILYLTQLHVGSTQKMRLPITTGYADKICKNLDNVPTGQVENKLFFL
ncbi:Piwi domain-containing protein [Pseudobutyrivibrio xylanivorans]|uniref:Protein argonaute n=1 Tax=Pseudobutyrivibrio xylanivorans TaxID=185007 RepID=A0A1G5S617_PSEXY|nr:Piwi domain-containing protein [Pseudobutyrivibrio xylanivorans]SCZ81340.1 Piwi domain-containing protein [Pseudobutyrivibrio xylanivorans]